MQRKKNGRFSELHSETAFHDWDMSSSCSLTNQLSNNSVKTVYAPQCSGFSLGHLHMGGGGICPPMTSALMGGLMREDIDLMGGPKFYRLYHKLKVLLL